MPQSEITEGIEAFYFPYKSLESPKVYRYTNSDNSEEHKYLYLHAFKKNNDFYLISSTYNISFRKEAEVTKKITSTGPVIVEYNVYLTNSKGERIQVPCFIEKGEILHWNCLSGDKTRWEVSYPIPRNPSCHQVLVKNREYINQKGYKYYKGKKYSVCRFFDTFQINEVCSSSSYEWVTSNYYHQNYYYAEGMGLIEYHYSTLNGPTKVFKLSGILGESEWEELFIKK
ncbi:hypothetical protein N9933_01575 [bacterium]|nr:hypothetical protein [bacterium]